MEWHFRNKKTEYDRRTLIMGIVNITPDSFSDGGRYTDETAAVEHALALIRQGADIVDLGAQSTRPGYREVPPEEEWRRLEKVLKRLRAATDMPISVDTYFPQVAEKAVAYGADILNDVSGTVSPEMTQIVKESGVGWIVMHNGSGSPLQVKRFFELALEHALACGIAREQLCFDPGIGFGKSVQENLTLIADIDRCKVEGIPLLLGVSRKRVIGAVSGQEEPAKRIYGNIAADTVGILKGVNVLRVHDVEHEIQGIRTADALKRYDNGYNHN